MCGCLKNKKFEHDPTNSKDTLQNLRTLIEQPLIIPSETELTDKVKKDMCKLPMIIQDAINIETANMQALVGEYGLEYQGTDPL